MLLEKKDIFTYIIFQNSDKIEELKNKIEITLSESDNLIIDIQNININKEKLVLSFLNYHSFFHKQIPFYNQFLVSNL